MTGYKGIFGTRITAADITRELKRGHLARSKKNIEIARDRIRKRNKRRHDPTGKDTSIIQSAADRQVIYGTCRVGGVMTFRHISTDNQFLYMVHTIAGHEIDTISKIFFDGEEIPVTTAWSTRPTAQNAATGNFANLVWFQVNYGATGQTALSQLVADVPSKWTSNDRQRGCAHVYIKLKWNADVWINGEPEITFEVNGKRVYDPRTGTTYFSNLSALCLSDYLMDSTFGYGRKIPQASINDTAWQAAANTCGESVALAAGGTEIRYTCNGYFGFSETPKSVIEMILATMMGDLSYVEGQYHIKPAVWRTPVVTLSEDDFLGSFTVRTKTSRRDGFNRVRGTYVASDKEYEEADFPPVLNATYLSEDNGEEVYEDMSYELVTSGATAQRLGKLALEETRQGITFAAPMKLRAYQAIASDNVNVNNTRLGWVDKAFKLTSVTPMAEADKGGAMAVTLMGTFQETSSGQFDWNSGMETTVDNAANTTLPNPASVGVISGLTLASGTTHLFLRDDGTVFTRIYASWTLPTDYFTLSGGKIEVQFKQSADSAWIDSTPIPGDQNYTYILDVKDTVQYDVRCRCVNALGIRGAWVTSSNHLVVGKTAAPSDVTGFAGSVQSFGQQLDWNDISDADRSHYEIRLGASWAAGSVVAKPQSTQIRLDVVTAGTYNYWIKAVDTTGNYSTNAATTAIVIAVPGVVQNLDVTVEGDNYLVSWAAPASPQFAVEEYLLYHGAVFGSATFIARIKGTKFSAKAVWLGSRTFWVQGIDVKGNLGTQTSDALTIVAPGAPENLTSQVIGSVVNLRWEAPLTGNLPVDHYRVYKGDTLSLAIVAGELGRVSGTFKTLPELIGGIFEYWVVPYDTAGNVGTEVSLEVNIADPGDYVFYDSGHVDFESGDLFNCAYEDYGGDTLVAMVDVSKNWTDHFVDNSWTTIQNQIDAGFPLYCQPTLISTAWWEQEFDLGAIVGGSIVRFIYTVVRPSGNVVLLPSISVSLDGVAWTDFPNTNQAYGYNFRYIKLRLDFSATATTEVVRVTNASWQVNVQEIHDGGFSTSNSGSAKTITFNKDFIDIISLAVSPSYDPSNQFVAEYEFTDVANPTSFNVYIFRRSDGVQVAVPFSWTALGV